jgi:hypothetical protein
MGKMQRRKGAEFEREIAQALGAKRNIGQARDGGDDITLGPYRIECKRRQRLGPMMQWLAQAIAACQAPDDVPVVVAREDGGRAVAILRFEDFTALLARHPREG